MYAVIFDVDGVLADSLAPHVDFCHDMNKKYGLGLHLPPRDQGRAIAGNPMDVFLRRAGFPGEIIPEMIKIYKATFAESYPVSPFPGVESMLDALSRSGIPLFIASSNHLVNIERSLGGLTKYFRRVYAQDNSASKGDGIQQCLDHCSLPPQRMVFVGDTTRDFASSRAKGVRFVGVGYGWEITEDEKRFPLALTVSDLEKILVDTCA